MTTVIFPVGHYTGALPSAIGAPNHVVRVGMKQHRLTDAEFGVWMLAHGAAEARTVPWTRRQMAAEASRLAVDISPDLLDGLEDRGLVFSIDPADPGVADIARCYRLEALMIGLGDTVEHPGHHRIGVPEAGVVAVLDPDSYELWQWAATTPSLWAYCQLRSTVASNEDPHGAADRVFQDLRTLIQHGCGYLDVVR
ncbi:hypothetical protein GCM10009745_38370 [Kribbella yunnanensis]|uniref:Uncharacterized protein n=1 Tax=Kribbella yunnanensis TaxID=190194 RepID=A0ABP4TLY6_9ACTN